MKKMVSTVWLAVVLMLMPAATRAQGEDTQRPIAWDIARAVLIDPTTYAPALVSYEAMRQDWKTSQPLFAHGWVEANARFTRSGRPNDVPVAHDEGKRLIRSNALHILQYSVVNNAAVGVAERLLTARFPSRKKLIRTLSWAERIGYASFVGYRNSAAHLRQTRANRRLALDYGYSSR